MNKWKAVLVVLIMCGTSVLLFAWSCFLPPSLAWHTWCIGMFILLLSFRVKAAPEPRGLYDRQGNPVDASKPRIPPQGGSGTAPPKKKEE